MTSFREEQQLELEALQSLFSSDNELVKHSSYAFELNLLPDLYALPDATLHVGVCLRIAYPETYPDVAPLWELENFKGLDAAQQSALRELVSATVERSLGCPMVYGMAEVIQSNYDLMMNRKTVLEDGVQDGGVLDRETLVARKAACSLQNRIEEDEDDGDGAGDSDVDSDTSAFRGLEEKDLCDESHRITEKEFFLWKESFFKEMVDKKIWSQKQRRAADQLTGKQMFERDHLLSKTAMEEPDDDKLSKSGLPLQQSMSMTTLHRAMGPPWCFLDNISDPELQWKDEKLFLGATALESDPFVEPDFSSSEDES